MSLRKVNEIKSNVEMKKKAKKIDPMFDGHLEKPLSSMSPRDKIYLLWLQMKFKYDIRNRKFIDKDSSKKING
jgi:hypothetical protein